MANNSKEKELLEKLEELKNSFEELKKRVDEQSGEWTEEDKKTLKEQTAEIIDKSSKSLICIGDIGTLMRGRGYEILNLIGCLIKDVKEEGVSREEFEDLLDQIYEDEE